MKKIMGLSALALASVIALTGCNKSSIDVDKANELMEQMQEHLNSPKEMTGIEMKKILLEKITKLSDTAIDHNYTLIKDGNEISRVEYTDGVTKVYHYSVDKDGNKINEVYREIHDDYVYTYVTTEDNEKLYSKVSLEHALSRYNLLRFDTHWDVAKLNQGQGVSSWEDVGISLPYAYNGDVYSVLSEFFDWVVEVSADELVYRCNCSFDENNVSMFVSQVYFNEGEEYSDTFRLISGMMEITDTSYKSYDTERTVHEGIPEVITQDNNDTSYTSVSSHELTFDKENTINFDKTGYALVDTYLNE